MYPPPAGAQALSDGGALLPILAFHLALTGLPGVAATLLAARRGARQVPLLLAIGLAATGLVAILAFWAYYADPLAGRSFAYLALFGSAGIAVWCLRGRRLDPSLLRALGTPLALWGLGSAFLVFFGFLHGGTDAPLSTAATRFAGELPSDNDIPRFFAEWFFLHGHEGTSPVYPAGWLSSDRPPLQIGYVLSQRDLAWSPDLQYQVLGVVLQQLWIVGLWALLLAAGIGRTTRALVVCAVLVSGLAIVNGFFVWPKLLPAAFLLAAAALLLTPLWPRLRREPRAGALVGGLLGLAMLGHGASAFAILPLAALAAARGLPSRSWLAAGLLAGLLLVAPWTAYQRYADPPGDRVVKWMLGGAVAIDDRSVPTAILDGYREAGVGGTLENKARNFATMTGGERALDEAVDAVDAALAGEPETVVRRVRGILFVHLLASLGLLLLALPAMLAGRGRAGRNPVEWRFALTCFAVVLLGCLAWGLLLFGSPPSRAMLHVSSYALPILAFCGAVAGLRAAFPRFAVWYVPAASAAMLALYAPALDPPPGSGYSALAALLAAAALGGFLAVVFRAGGGAAANRLGR